MSQTMIQTISLSYPSSIFDPNSAGEIKGYGAPWVCAAYGDEGHDYFTCPDCHGNFDRHFTKEAA